MEVGFIGLGVMGKPMALNLVRSGREVVVWNRSAAPLTALREAGARVAASPAEVFARAEVVLLMLANEAAIDEVLARSSGGLPSLVAGRTVVTMGTTAAAYSLDLAHDITAAGGRYAECPVSGSRPVAEAAQLVAMLAGPPDVRDQVQPIVAPMCAKVVPCGEVPTALLTKLAVNVFLIAQVTGLAESFQFAVAHGLDLRVFQEVLDSGPMASTVSRARLAKLVDGDYDVQTAIADVAQNTRLITGAARTQGVATPLLDVCEDLFRETELLGNGSLDMAAVVTAIAARSDMTQTHSPSPAAPTSADSCPFTVFHSLIG